MGLFCNRRRKSAGFGWHGRGSCRSSQLLLQLTAERKIFTAHCMSGEKKLKPGHWGARKRRACFAYPGFLMFIGRPIADRAGSWWSRVLGWAVRAKGWVTNRENALRVEG